MESHESPLWLFILLFICVSKSANPDYFKPMICFEVLLIMMYSQHHIVLWYASCGKVPTMYTGSRRESADKVAAEQIPWIARSTGETLEMFTRNYQLKNFL